MSDNAIKTEVPKVGWIIIKVKDILIGKISQHGDIEIDATDEQLVELWKAGCYGDHASAAMVCLFAAVRQLNNQVNGLPKGSRIILPSRIQ
jgi:hypothetical protein